MKYLNRNSRQRGAALIVGLILLAVITLLAVVGMNISNAELASANSEQIRIRAFQAAETGIEHGIFMVEGGAAKGTRATPETLDPVGVEGSPEDLDGNAIDSYTLTTARQGEGSAPGYGTQFRAFHFSIESEGRSARNTAVRNETGAFVVNGIGGGTGTFEALPE
jgi:Tfp pilus assembly protein PilX